MLKKIVVKQSNPMKKLLIISYTLVCAIRITAMEQNTVTVSKNSFIPDLLNNVRETLEKEQGSPTKNVQKIRKLKRAISNAEKYLKDLEKAQCEDNFFLNEACSTYTEKKKCTQGLTKSSSSPATFTTSRNTSTTERTGIIKKAINFIKKNSPRLKRTQSEIHKKK